MQLIVSGFEFQILGLGFNEASLCTGVIVEPESLTQSLMKERSNSDDNASEHLRNMNARKIWRAKYCNQTKPEGRTRNALYRVP